MSPALFPVPPLVIPALPVPLPVLPVPPSSLDAKGDEGDADHQQVQEVEPVAAEGAFVQEGAKRRHLGEAPNPSIKRGSPPS